jgi:SpoVK/Ycf46/Vps4 family AAA+-type ATPase
MSVGIAIFTAVCGAMFLGLLVLALLGWLSAGKTTEDAVPTGPKKSGRAVPAQRRTSRSRKRDQITLLPEDATVTFAAEREAAGIDEVFAGLDNDLVGLGPVKEKVQEIAALLLVDAARRKFGLNAPRPNLHMCFTGPPGTGKTTVALRMAELLTGSATWSKGS